MNARYEQLLNDGYLVYRNVLTTPILERLRRITTRLAEVQNRAEPSSFRAQGSMVRTQEDPIFAELITWEPSLSILRDLGFTSPTFTDGYVISKPPDSPRLFWHYDWFSWDAPGAFDPEPQQLFLMYYLTKTRRENGCLRLIPGTHTNHNPLHDLLGEPHSTRLSSPDDLLAHEFTDRADEIDVPVSAGDLVMGDARILHAAHANKSCERRTVITLWYQPTFDRLPDSVKAQMVLKTQAVPSWWPPESRTLVEAMQPRYHGVVEPCIRSLYHRPPDYQ